MATNAAKKQKEKELKKAPAKQKEEKLPSREDMASALIEHVKTKMKGKAELVRSSELALTYINKRIPTGLLSLDLALMGGFPCAGVSQIIGRKNAGKSYLYWRMIRQLQQLLGDKLHVLLAMTELRADRTQARLCGVQVALSDEDIEEQQKAREKNGWPPLTTEEIRSLKTEVGHIHELHGLDAVHLYDAIVQAVEMNVYHLIIIDSIGNMMSDQERENDSVGDKTYSGVAGINTTMLHKVTSMLMMKDENGRERETCMIVVNQVRDNIKDPNKEYKASGGNALEHAKFVDLLLFPGPAIGEEISVPNLVKGGTKQQFTMYGKEVNWRIEKGKCGIHEGGRGSYVYDFRINGADDYLDTIVAGTKPEIGVIAQAGAWLTLVDPDTGAPLMQPDTIVIQDPENPKKTKEVPNPKRGQELFKHQGREKFKQALIEDAMYHAANGTYEDSIMTLIRALAFKKAGINITYEWSY
jgi:RecA/RadA recombinase